MVKAQRPVFSDPGKIFAVFASEDNLPAWVSDGDRYHEARFVYFPALDRFCTYMDIFVNGRGLGILKDPEFGGAMVVAPTILEAGDYVSEHRMIFDREKGEWVESFKGDSVPGWSEAYILGDD